MQIESLDQSQYRGISYIQDTHPGDRKVQSKNSLVTDVNGNNVNGNNVNGNLLPHEITNKGFA